MHVLQMIMYYLHVDSVACDMTAAGRLSIDLRAFAAMRLALRAHKCGLVSLNERFADQMHSISSPPDSDSRATLDRCNWNPSFTENK